MDITKTQIMVIDKVNKQNHLKEIDNIIFVSQLVQLDFMITNTGICHKLTVVTKNQTAQKPSVPSFPLCSVRVGLLRKGTKRAQVHSKCSAGDLFWKFLGRQTTIFKLLNITKSLQMRVTKQIIFWTHFPKKRSC